MKLNYYKNMISEIKKEELEKAIQLIEWDLKLLMPYDYVLCKDGVPRIGTKLEYSNKEFVKNSVEIQTYFANNGFLIEEFENGDVIIYIQDNEVAQTSKLYNEIIERLKEYAYTKWQSNWPSAVNENIMKSDSNNIMELAKNVSENMFEDVRGIIENLTELEEIKIVDGVGEYSFGKVFYNEETSLSKEFLSNQGFEFYDANKICGLPHKNEDNNNIIKYCYETLYGNIMNKFLYLKHRYTMLSKLIIQGRLPEEVENALKDDGFIVNIFEEKTVISLV